MCFSSDSVTCDMLKISFCIINIVLMVASISIIVVSLISHKAVSEIISEVIGSRPFEEANLMIPLGIFGFILFFMGCNGIHRGNVLFLYTYSVTMFILFCCVFIYTLATFTGSHVERKKEIVNELQSHFINYVDNMTSKTYVNTVQRAYHCCGLESMQDYEQLNILMLPTSCCNPNGRICSKRKAFPNGCNKASVDAYDSFLSRMLVMHLSIATFLISLAGLAFSFAFRP